MDNKKVALLRNKFYCICGKKYAFQSGLCKHKKKCSHINKEKAHKSNINKNKSQEILIVEDDKDDLKNIFKAFMKSQTEFNKIQLYTKKITWTKFNIIYKYYVFDTNYNFGNLFNLPLL